ncbi:MAG: class I SAM-dependent methyltransferase [archaeon]|nr:class I SAM-dependent methyltransferase [archaeon]
MENKFEKNYFENYEFNGKTFTHYSGPFSAETPEFVEAVKEKVFRYKKNGKLLDVGCAEGHFLKAFSQNFEVYGIDISNYAVQKAKNLNKKFEKNIFAHSADADWNFPEKFFDAIIINHTIEHLHDPKKCLQNAFIHLKDNGILYIAFPTKLYELPKFIPNYKKTTSLLNKFLHPIHFGNFRIQFGTDITHISNPWPWNVADNSFLSPYFEPVYIFPQKFHQKIIAGSFEIVARKKIAGETK